MKLDVLKKNKLPLQFVFALFLVYIFSFCFFYHFQFMTPFIPETDGHYHIKIAYLMRSQNFFHGFKYAHLSFWRDSFSDKEFLFHVLLIPFTFLKDLTFAAKIATVTIASIIFTSFFAILKLNRIKYSLFWLLLLSISGGYFLYRANVCRPQILSITLTLWSIHFIINKQRIGLLIIGFIYTYSYTAYHLPLIFALIASAYLLLFENIFDWKTPLTALIAILAGMLLSPFFPHNWEMFFLQNFYVLFMYNKGNVNLHMGGELSPMNTKSLLLVNTAVIIPYFLVFFTGLIKPLKTSSKTNILFLMSLALILLTFMTKRFAEYSVPVTLLFCAFYFTEQLKQYSFKALLNPLKGKLAFLAIIFTFIGLSINSYIDVAQQFSGARENDLKEAALYLKEHTNDNELVFTGDWDDAPGLFFYNDKNRYFVFLDPNFMYYWDKDVWKKWDDTVNGRMGNKTYDILKNDFKVNYGVATSNFSNFKKIITNDQHMKIVYQDRNAFVFKLD